MKISTYFIVTVLLFSSTIFAQVGINTDNSMPNGSAMLDVKSTSQGFLPPRMTTAQRNTIVSPGEGLVIYNTDEKALNLFNGTDWKSMMPSQTFSCGLTISINHLVSGGVAPVTKTVAYGTVTGIPGEPSKCWITSNLGSDHQAASMNDATESSAGWYFQFNRKQGFKHDGTTRTPNTTWIDVIEESSDWITANDPCSLELGTAWRMPTFTEWTNVYASGSWANYGGAFGSALRLHPPGYLMLYSAQLFFRGYIGYYWSSTQVDDTHGWCLNLDNGYSSMDNTSDKAFGFSVRCLRDL